MMENQKHFRWSAIDILWFEDFFKRVAVYSICWEWAVPMNASQWRDNQARHSHTTCSLWSLLRSDISKQSLLSKEEVSPLKYSREMIIPDVQPSNSEWSQACYSHFQSLEIVDRILKDRFHHYLGVEVINDFQSNWEKNERFFSPRFNIPEIMILFVQFREILSLNPKATTWLYTKDTFPSKDFYWILLPRTTA